MFTNLIQTNLTTLTLGKRIEHFTWSKSTNDEAWELIDEGALEGTIITTDKQTAGKGRNGRKWFSVSGKSLTASLILQPDIHSQYTSCFPMLAGVAVANALDTLGLKSKLKWPNDIMVHGKKIGGLLCEGKTQGKTLKWVVIGFGLNINEQDFELDKKLNATSFFIETNKSIQRELILSTILNHLEPLYQFAKNENDFASIIDLWTKRCDHLDKTITFKGHDGQETGFFTGINDRGEAVLSIEGKEQIFNSGDIHLII